MSMKRVQASEERRLALSATTTGKAKTCTVSHVENLCNLPACRMLFWFLVVMSPIQCHAQGLF